MNLPVVRDRSDHFHCDTYHCDLSADACLKRQGKALRVGNFKRGARGDTTCGPRCDQGAAIKAAVGSDPAIRRGPKWSVRRGKERKVA